MCEYICINMYIYIYKFNNIEITYLKTSFCIDFCIVLKCVLLYLYAIR